LVTSEQAYQVLKGVFGYEQFRPLQEEVIQQVLNKKDALVVMPTGGGKSLCYQIPALLFDGLTVVVSPLISLMKDQVEQLESYGVAAVYLNSSLSLREYQQNVNMIQQGKAKLLYVAPETLMKQRMRNLLTEIKIDCLTIDEAHCISEWGHDFRPDYRQIARLRTDFPEAVCLALTATATPRVREDIKMNLNLDDSETFIASFNRENLYIEISEKLDPFQQTLSFLEKHKDQSGIIYCFSRRQVDELTEDLNANGYSVKPYHAGLSELKRSENQELFIRDDINIMVATIAFGMGINKPDVRFVIHYDLPQNIESYYQQIGRAGRDGLRADCLLLFSYSDIGKINYIIKQKSPGEQKIARSHLDALIHFVEAEQCRRIPLMNYFGEKYPVKSCEMCDNCVYGNSDKKDLTVPAQKYLSCVIRTGQIFGIGHINAVLRGSKKKQVLEHKHDKLSTYGIGRELSGKQWSRLARQLIRDGYLSKDPQFGSLKIESPAKEILNGQTKVFGTVGRGSKKKSDKAHPGPVGKGSVEYDSTLFSLLKKQRKLLADEEQRPPYTVFPDTTLMEMAYYYPQSFDSLLTIYGVGIAKRNKYGESFLEIIIDYCKANDIQERPKKTRRRHSQSHRRRHSQSHRRRHRQVGDLFNEGKSIQQLTEQLSVQPGTIIQHLEKYHTEGNPLRPDGILEASSLSPKQRKRVLQVFEKEGDELLKPVYDSLNEEISYDEIRLLRLYNFTLDDK
jgi:ATP-dependent DNA helicase RecQ